MKQAARVAGKVSVLATFIPLIPSDMWFIRMFDFPHVQIAVLTLLSFVGLLITQSLKTWRDFLLPGAVFAALVCQVIIIYPYTFVSPCQVLLNDNPDKDASIRLLSTNVLMDNRGVDKVLQIIAEEDPDVALLLEPDEWWKDQMQAIHDQYPYRIAAALPNTYGMMLYSKYKLIDPQVKYLVKPDIPSMECKVVLPNGQMVKLYAVHPEPPSPTENSKSTDRDGELMIVGKKAAKDTLPVIVVGDLNDVAWSQSTKLFQKISQLLDPRIGRGFYNTYNANFPILRWPLDHLFHSNHFKLNKMERLDHVGSDHFPILIDLCYKPEAKHQQKEPTASSNDQKKAQKQINKAK